MDHDLPAYLRHPTIHGETIVFVADDDLWTRERRRRRRPAPDRGPLGALHALPLARRQAARLRRPRRAASRGLRHAGRRRPGAPPHLARHRHAGARLDAGTARSSTSPPRASRSSATTTPSSSTPPAARRGRCPGARSTTSPSVRASASVIGRNTADPARWKRYRGGTAGALWIDAEGSGSFRRMKRAAGQRHQPDVARRPRLVPRRRRRRRQPLLLPARRQRAAPPHRPRGLLRPPCADRRPAHRLPVRREDPAVRPGQRERPRGRDPHARRTAPRRRASSLPPASTWSRSACIRPATRWRWWRAASCSAWRSGRARRAATPGPKPARMRHGQWLGDGSTLVAVSDASGEERVVAFAGHEAKVLPWDTGHVTRMRAAPQGSLVAFANHRNEVWIGDVVSGELARRRRQRRRAQRRSRLVARRRLARLHLRHQHPPRRHQAARGRGAHQHARHRARVPRLLARRSTPTASTSTSCRCAPTTRSTTASSSR